MIVNVWATVVSITFDERPLTRRRQDARGAGLTAGCSLKMVWRLLTEQGFPFSFSLTNKQTNSVILTPFELEFAVLWHSLRPFVRQATLFFVGQSQSISWPNLALPFPDLPPQTPHVVLQLME